MKKTFNYISYCIYSFMPLYIFLLIYSFIKQDIVDAILVLLLIIYSVFSLIILNYSKPNNIFVCSHKELHRQEGIDYAYLILMIAITFLIINEKLQFSIKVMSLLIIFFILFKILFKYKCYTLILLGYKMYEIRDKIVYSKKSQKELYELLKNKKSIQVIEINDNLLIEDEKYTITRFYCKDF